MTTLTYGEKVALRVATADQQHTAKRLAEAFGAAGAMIDAQHPWYLSLGEKLVRGLVDGSTRICPHLGPRRRLGPMYVVLTSGPMLINCQACLVAHRQRLSLVDNSTCDRCSVYTRRGLTCGALPVGPLLFAFGVCSPCWTELNGGQGRGPRP